MINPQDFIGWLGAFGVDFYAGVPDSLLKPLCFYLDDHVGNKHVVAANEGGAVALACGYHLATGKVPLVYMQNSGQETRLTRYSHWQIRRSIAFRC